MIPYVTEKMLQTIFVIFTLLFEIVYFQYFLFQINGYFGLGLFPAPFQIKMFCQTNGHFPPHTQRSSNSPQKKIKKKKEEKENV